MKRMYLAVLALAILLCLTACASISQTCFNLTEYQEITFSAVTQKNVIRIVRRDSFLLADTVTATTE